MSPKSVAFAVVAIVTKSMTFVLKPEPKTPLVADELAPGNLRAEVKSPKNTALPCD